ncbi:hypothetical protein C4D60_Mb09t26420 [Musa balbisiana]|uniref:Uncharacterized protein n=1 Tax=Musa balbisiana TaxID=52838 RepID=A0A4S8IJB1_MUSBA|nr:hypothetical protein C4D60_Mb09t26420 [Musa balbisiana]
MLLFLLPKPQRAKNDGVGSLSRAKRTTSSIDRRRREWRGAEEKAKRSEEALRTVITKTINPNFSKLRIDIKTSI